MNCHLTQAQYEARCAKRAKFRTLGLILLPVLALAGALVCGLMAFVKGAN